MGPGSLKRFKCGRTPSCTSSFIDSTESKFNLSSESSKLSISTKARLAECRLDLRSGCFRVKVQTIPFFSAPFVALQKSSICSLRLLTRVNFLLFVLRGVNPSSRPTTSVLLVLASGWFLLCPNVAPTASPLGMLGLPTSSPPSD